MSEDPSLAHILHHLVMDQAFPVFHYLDVSVVDFPKLTLSQGQRQLSSGGPHFLPIQTVREPVLFILWHQGGPEKLSRRPIG